MDWLKTQGITAAVHHWDDGARDGVADAMPPNKPLRGSDLAGHCAAAANESGDIMLPSTPEPPAVTHTRGSDGHRYRFYSRGVTKVNDEKINYLATPPPKVIAIADRPRQVSTETVLLLEQLLEEAKAGSATGLAMVVLRPHGNYDLRVRGEATDAANQMSVAGMLAALQKMVLESGEYGYPS